MKDKPFKTSRPGGALAIGLAATGIIALVCTAGTGQRVELMALDSLFRHFSPATADDEILHIDIDDGSIEQIGRWPWPRAQMAGVIDVLNECGAKAIVLDIIFPNPQEVRYESAVNDVYGDVDVPLAADVPPTPVFDDALLADAIGRAPRLALPMYIDFVDKADAQSQRMHTGTGQQVLSPELQLRAKQAMLRFAVEPLEAAGHQLAEGPMTAPLATFAEKADISGFVTFAPDIDGVVRRIFLLGRSNGSTYLQLGLAVAADELAGRHSGTPSLIIAEKNVTLVFPDGAKRAIPTDDQGQMLIDWRKLEGRHIPISAAASIWQQRRRMDRNNRLARLTSLDIAKRLDQQDLLEMFSRADKLYTQRIAAQRQQYIASLRGSDEDVDVVKLLTAEAQLENEMDIRVAELREELDEFYLVERPSSPDAAAVYDELVELRDRLGRIDAANIKIAHDIEVQLARVGDRVAGKICLIGSTATSAPDFVPTPLGPRTPGNVVHANVFSTILSGRFIRPTGPIVMLLIILATGAMVSAVAACTPMLQAAVAAAALAAGYLAFAAWVAFVRWGLWLPVVGPTAAVVACFLAVAVYRQLTEERAKQHIRKMFSHALSPTLVDRLLDDPSLAQLGGQRRHITVMFSDLAGFTALSKKFGPQQTVSLLNRYFDRVTEVVQQRGGGYLNKFLGDGVFCFFGAPIDQPDHASRALRAGIEYHHEVVRLNADLAEEFGESARLTVRVGICSGEAMVGNCGSSERMDYTAIGDCVNLASRMESANKLLGTGILATENTWCQAHEANLQARCIGRAIVFGFAEPIRIWQILVDSGLSNDRAQWLGNFARAVELFERSRFQEANNLFSSLQQTAGDDRPTQIYRVLCNYALSWKPGQPWQPPGETRDGVITIAPPLAQAVTGDE